MDPPSLSQLDGYMASSYQPRPLESCQNCDICDDIAVVLALIVDSQAQMLERQNLKDFLFHEICAPCDASHDEGLCAYCKHLRLGHLTRHALLEYPGGVWEYNPRKSTAQEILFLSIGSREDLLRRSHGCHLCHAFTVAIGTDVHCGVDKDVLLRFSVVKDRHRTSQFPSDLELSISVGDLALQNCPDFVCLPERPYLRNLARSELPGATVDWKLLSMWLGRSQPDNVHHPARISARSQPLELRMVDIERSCVVRGSLDCKYATLSYVWGVRKSNDLEARTDNIAALETEGALSIHSLPKTIYDAMVACKKLKIRYLWVDRLCILQDKAAEHVSLPLINAMGDIYQLSCVTIVDLDGHDAHHGLPGVFSTPREPLQVFKAQGVYLVKRLPLPYTQLLSQSKWMTRGWTFQEAFLAPRILLFSETGVFFESKYDNDEFRDEFGGIREKYLARTQRLTEERNVCSFLLPPYRLLLQGYTKRHLTLDSDALRAVSGILYTQYNADHYYGIPFSEFDRAIMWWPKGGQHIPRFPGTGDVFPSWSWLSVKGEIDIAAASTAERQKWFYDPTSNIAASLAVWAIPTVGHTPDNLRIIRDTSNCRQEPPQWTLGGTPYSISTLCNAKALLIAWKHGCLDGSPFPPLDNKPIWRKLFQLISRYRWISACLGKRKLPAPNRDIDTTWTHVEDFIQSRWTSPEQMWEEAQGIAPTGLRFQDRKFPSPLIEKASRPGRLLVYTQFLRLRPTPASQSDIGIIELQDEHETIIAEILDDATDKGKLIMPSGEGDSVFFDAIALSLKVESEEAIDCTFHEQSIYWRDSEGQPLSHIVEQFATSCDECGLKVNLMILRTNHEGISTRVGIAEAYLKIWVQRRREFKTFVLE